MSRRYKHRSKWNGFRNDTVYNTSSKETEMSIQLSHSGISVDANIELTRS